MSKSVESQTSAQQLEQARARYQTLIEQRARAQAEYNTAKRQLDEARKEAEALFGTGDLGKLRELHASRERANQQAVSGFLKALEECETALNKAENILAA